MKKWFAHLKRWYFWRFHKTVQAPGGTRWKQHLGAWQQPFVCSCANELWWYPPKEYVVIHQAHTAECLAAEKSICLCPVISARYVKVCPYCGDGHWMDASPKPGRRSAYETKSHG
jgi:hypothetical protein